MLAEELDLTCEKMDTKSSVLFREVNESLYDMLKYLLRSLQRIMDLCRRIHEHMKMKHE